MHEKDIQEIKHKKNLQTPQQKQPQQPQIRQNVRWKKEIGLSIGISCIKQVWGMKHSWTLLALGVFHYGTVLTGYQYQLSFVLVLCSIILMAVYMLITLHQIIQHQFPIYSRNNQIFKKITGYIYIWPGEGVLQYIDISLNNRLQNLSIMNALYNACAGYVGNYNYGMLLVISTIYFGIHQQILTGVAKITADQQNQINQKIDDETTNQQQNVQIGMWEKFIKFGPGKQQIQYMAMLQFQEAILIWVTTLLAQVLQYYAGYSQIHQWSFNLLEMVIPIILNLFINTIKRVVQKRLQQKGKDITYKQENIIQIVKFIIEIIFIVMAIIANIKGKMPKSNMRVFKGAGIEMLYKTSEFGPNMVNMQKFNFLNENQINDSQFQQNLTQNTDQLIELINLTSSRYPGRFNVTKLDFQERGEKILESQYKSNSPIRAYRQIVNMNPKNWAQSQTYQRSWHYPEYNSFKIIQDYGNTGTFSIFGNTRTYMYPFNAYQRLVEIYPIVQTNPFMVPGTWVWEEQRVAEAQWTCKIYPNNSQDLASYYNQLQAYNKLTDWQCNQYQSGLLSPWGKNFQFIINSNGVYSTVDWLWQTLFNKEIQKYLYTPGPNWFSVNVDDTRKLWVSESLVTLAPLFHVIGLQCDKNNTPIGKQKGLEVQLTIQVNVARLNRVNTSQQLTIDQSVLFVLPQSITVGLIDVNPDEIDKNQTMFGPKNICKTVELAGPAYFFVLETTLTDSVVSLMWNNASGVDKHIKMGYQILNFSMLHTRDLLTLENKNEFNWDYKDDFDIVENNELSKFYSQQEQVNFQQLKLMEVIRAKQSQVIQLFQIQQNGPFGQQVNSQPLYNRLIISIVGINTEQIPEQTPKI